MKELKMMFRLLRASAKSQMMYRANFIIGLLGTLAYNGTFLATVGIIANTFGSFGSFSGWEIMLLYALFEIAHGLYGFFLANMTDHLETVVAEGTLDILFMRPYSILIQLNSRKMDYVSFVDVFIGLICLAFSCISMDISWSAQWLMLPIFVVSGAFIEFSLSLIMNCLTIAFPYTNSIYGAYYQFVLMGQRYPLNIFAKGFQAILTFVFPLGFINYYPMLCLMGHENGWIGYLAPFVAVAFTLIAVKAFNNMLKHYNSTGN